MIANHTSRLSVFTKLSLTFIFIACLSIWPGGNTQAEDGVNYQADLNMNFSPLAIPAGGVSRLSISIYNPNPFPLVLSSSPNPAWSNVLDTHLDFANPANISTDCGGTVTTIGKTISLIGGSVPAKNGTEFGHCTVSVDVTSSYPANIPNTIPANTLVATNPDATINVTNPTNAQISLLVNAVQPPSLSTTFAPNTMWVARTSVLTLTIRNNDANTTLDQLSLTDNLPPEIKVANPANPSTTCSGTVEASPGSSTVRLMGGTAPIGGTCTVSVTVTSTIPGVYTNLIPANSLQTQQGVTNLSAAAAPLNVQSIGILKAFSPADFQSGNSSTLIITLQNPTGVDYHGAQLTDTFPAGLLVASAPDSPQCGGTVTYTSNSVTLQGGTIPAGNPGTCQIRVAVTATTPATYTNVIPVGALTTADGASNVVAATANISVYAPGLGLNASKGFNSATIPVNGRSQLSINLTAPGDIDLHHFSLVDSLPEGVRVDAVPGITTTNCGTPAFTSAAGDTVLHFSNGTILAGATCTMRVFVTSDAPGVYVNTISPANLSNDEHRNLGGNITATLTVSGLSVSKMFMPTSVNPGGISTLSITLGNDNPTQIDNVSFSDVLPATDIDNGIFLADTPNIRTTCGSPDGITVSTDGNGIQTLSLTGGTIPAKVGAVQGICTVDVDVVGRGNTHTYTNQIAANSVLGTIHGDGTIIHNPVAAQATLAVLEIHIDVVQGFSPQNVSSGSSSTLTINLTNPNSVPLTGIHFTDHFPVPNPDTEPNRGMKLATPAIYSVGTCGGTISGEAGATSFTFSGGYLAANTTCSLTLQVTMNVNSNLINVIHAGEVQSSNGAVNLQDASATLTNQPAASVSKIFGPNPIDAGPGNSSTLTITIQNYSNFPITGVGLVDTLPANMTVTAAPTTTCAIEEGGSLSENAGVISLISARLEDLAFCTITVQVTAPTAGQYQNCIPEDTLVTNQTATNSSPACDTLTVLATPTDAEISKVFSPQSIPTGSVSSLSITIHNPNDVALENIHFSDVLPDPLTLASVPNASQCNGDVSAPDEKTLVLGGASLAANASCTVTASVTANTAGTYTNTTQPFGWTYNGKSYTGGTATDDLTVVAPPVISKAFLPDAITAGGTSTLTFTLQNPAANSVALTGVAFTDPLPTGLSLAEAPTQNQCNGTVGVTGQSIHLSGGSIPVGGSCTVSVNVTGNGGEYLNTSLPVTSTNGGTGNTAQATLNISGGGLRLEKTALSAGFHALPDQIQYAYTLENTGDVSLYGTGPAGVFMLQDDKLGAFACDASTTSLASQQTLVCDPQTYTVVQADVDARQVTNTATASGTDAPGGGNLVTSNPDSVTVRLESIQIDKNTSTGGYRSLDDPIVYSFTITNTGDVPLYGTGSGGVFMVQDDLVGDFVCSASVTSLAPGANLPCAGTKTYHVTNSDLTAGSVTNHAYTHAQDQAAGGKTIQSNQDSVQVFKVNPPTITKAFDPNTIAVGENSTLTFTLVNPVSNTVPLTGVQFVDHLPSGVTVANPPLESQCGGTVTATEDTITFSDGTIISDGTGVNNRCTVTVVVTGGAAGVYDNTSDAITSTNGGDGETSNTATLTVIAPPLISKAFSPTTILPGGISQITFTLTNPNAAYALSGVGFADTFPDDLVVADPANTAMNGCGTLAFDPAPQPGDDNLTLVSGQIAAGVSCTVSINVTAPTPGDKLNTTGVVVSTEGGSGSTSNTAVLRVINPHLSLEKSIVSGDLYRAVGDHIQYNYLLTNDGNVTLIGAGLNGLFTITDDQINAGTAFNCPPTQAPTGLAPGNTLTCTAEYVVSQSDLDYGSVTNTAQAHGKYDTTAIDSNTDTAIARAAPLLTKQLTTTSLNTIGNNSADQAAIGETVTYTLTLTVPKGQFSAAGLTDTLEAGLSFSSVQSVTVDPAINSQYTIGTGGAPAHVTISSANGGTNNRLVFDFGSLNNTSDDYSQHETIVIVYQATVQNVTGNQAGASLDNSASFAWTGDGVNQTGATTAVGVVEPTLLIQKQQTSTGYDAGDQISYQVTLTNNAASTDTTAYKATFNDVIPAGLAYNAGSAAISAIPGECSAGAPDTTFAYDGATHTLSAAWLAVQPGTSCIFTFTADLAGDVHPGQTIPANTAEVRWTSLPGSVTGERSGADGLLGGGSLNDYRQQSTVAAFDVENVAVQKSVVTTSEAHTSGNNVAIGEIVRYRLAMQLPEGSVTNLQLLDSFAGTGAGQRFLDDGTARVLFIGTQAGSLTSAAVGDTPALSACANAADAASYTLADVLDTVQIPSSSINCSLADANISSAEDSNQANFGTNTAVHFRLGSLTNDDNDADAEFIVVEFNALVTNEAGNTAGKTLTDSFITRFYNGTAMADLGTASTPTSLTIVEPGIPFSGAVNNKTASITGGDGGDAVDYTVTYTADNGANHTDAYDVRLVDDLSSLPLTNFDFDPLSDVTLTTCTDPGTLDDNSTATGLDLTIPHVVPGCTVTVHYHAVLSNTLAPNQAITNTARLTYTSLPGTGTTPNDTGSTTSGTSGDVTNERNGSGVAPNTYTGSDTATLTGNNIAVQKAVVSTSEAATSGTNAAIGEVIRYRLVVQLPESTITDLQLLDSFAGTGGQLFLDDLSRVKFVFVGDGTVSSAAYGSGGGAIPAVPASACANYSGTFTLADAANPAVIPSSAVQCELADANISTAEATNADTFGANDAVHFKLGTVLNSDTDNNQAEFLILEYDALVTNEAINVAGDSLTDHFQTRYYNGTAMANLGAVSGTTTLTVVEPQIPFNTTANNKTITSAATNVDAGDQLDYRVHYANSGTSNAYEVVVTDNLAALPLGNLTNIVTAYEGASCVTQGTISTTGSTQTSLEVSVPLVEPGCAVTITYSATATQNIAPSQTYTNTASISYTSLPGTQGTASATPGAAGSATGERTGSGANPPNSYLGSDTASFTSRLPVLTKTLYTTELNVAGNNELGQAVIGELLTYQLSINVPEGKTPALNVVDTLDAGLAFVDCLSVNATTGVTTDLAGGFTDACQDSASGGNLLISGTGGVATFTLGTITNANTDNATPDTITIRYTVVPLNKNNAPNLQAGSQLNNSAVLSWTGGNQAANSAPNVTIVEPTLTISQTRTVTGHDAGDTTRFSITVTNGNTAGDTVAYDAVMSDVIPTGLTYVPGSAVTTTCTAGEPVFGGSSTLTATWATFPTNSSCTFTIDTTLDATVYPGQSIAANTAQVRWTSISGDRSDVSPYNTASDERTGADGLLGGGTLNDYRQQNATTAFTVDNVAVQKSLVGTSESHTTGTNVTIGEIVRYRLAMQLPEGTVNNLQMLDSFAGTGAGQRFLNDGSARVLFIGTHAGSLTSATSGTIPGLSGCTNLADPSSYTLANVTNPATLSSSAVSCALADGNISTAEGSNLDDYNTNTPVYFRLGTLTNSDNDADAEYVIVEFNALVTNEANNRSGRTLTDSFIGRRFNGTAMANLGTASGSTTLTIVEPSITNVDLTAATVNTPPDAGDTVTYTVQFSNSGGSDALDVHLTDDISALPLTNLSFTPATDLTFDTGTCGDLGTVTNNSTASKVDLTLQRMIPTCQVQVVFTAEITSSAAPGEGITDRTDVTYTSLPGDGTRSSDTTHNLTGSQTAAASSGDVLGERNGSGAAPNTYADDDTAALQINTPALVKSIVSTSETSTVEDGVGSGADPRLVAVGEVIRYRMDVTLPEGTSDDLTLTDVLPAGLSYLGNPRILLSSDQPMSLPADLTGADVGSLPPSFALPAGRIDVSDQTLTFSLGDLVNQDSDTDAEKVIIDFNVLVNNDASTNNGDLKDNDFSLSIGGSAMGSSAAVRVKIVEPLLDLSKSANPDTAWKYGDTLTYTLRLSHKAASAADAFDLSITDTIPGGLTYVDGSITAPAGWSADDSSAPALSWSCTSPTCSFPRSTGSADFTYQVTVDPTSAAGRLIGSATAVNTADLTWTSLPGIGSGSNPTGSTTPGSAGASDGERDGSATPALNDYHLEAQHSGSLTDYYAVGNRVWLDENNNALLDGSEDGIDGVEVQLFASTDLTTPLASATTADGGYYLFDYLLSGEYVIGIPSTNFGSGAVLQGYWSSLARKNTSDVMVETQPDDPDNDEDLNDDGMWSDPNVYSKVFTLGPSGDTEPVGETDTQTGVGQGDLPDSHANLTLDFGFFLPATVGDTVWNDVNANGLQDSGEGGVAGIYIDLYTDGDMQLVTTLTDENGHYTFAGIAPGSYYLLFTKPSGTSITPQNAGSDRGIDSDADPTTGRTATFTLVSDQTKLDVDLGLYQPASLGNLVWDDLNANGVQDIGESGIGSVTVDLYTSGDSHVSTTVTNSSGIYSFTGVVPGDYYVQFTKPAGSTISVQNAGGDDALDSDADPANGKTAVTSLTSGENDTSWDLGIYQPASIGDLVWEDQNANGIQDNGEPGVSGLNVDLYSSAGDLLSSTNTDTNGNYQFTGLIPGDYYLDFSKPAGALFSPTGTGSDPSKDSDADLLTGETGITSLVSGDNDDTWDMGFYYLVDVGGVVWYDIDGDGVQDSGEPPIPGASIQVTWAGVDGDLATTADNTLLTLQTSAADGSWGISDLTPGTYRADTSGLPAGLIHTTYDLDGTSTPNRADFNAPSSAGRHDVDFGYNGTASLGDFVWADLDHDGVQGLTEPGVSGATLSLTWGGLDNDLETPADNLAYPDFTTTADGQYLFDHLPVGVFQLSAGLPSGDLLTSLHTGSNPAIDSDFDPSTGKTAAIQLTNAENNLTVDAGIIQYSIAKALSATSLVATTDNSLTIGEVATFALTLNFPTGDSALTQVIDTLPAGLAYVSGSAHLDLTGFDGSATLNNVTDLSSLLTFDLGTVTVHNGAAEDAHNLVLYYDALVQDVAGNFETADDQTEMENTASLRIGSGPDLTSNPVTLQVVEPRLTLEKTISTDTASHGDTVTFHLKITNHGSSPAYDVILSDPLSDTDFTDILAVDTAAGFAFTATPGSGTTTVQYTSTGLSIPAGGEVAFSFQAKVADTAVAGAVIHNTATITQAATLPGPDTNRRLEPNVEDTADLEVISADLAIVKTGAASQYAGTDLVYTLTVSNQGPTIAQDVAVSDPLPTGVSLISVTPDTLHAWTCSGTTTVSCTLPSLAVSDSTTLTLTVHIALDTTGTLDNIATVTGTLEDPDPSNNTSQISTIVLPPPHVTASKLAAEIDQDGKFFPGDIIEYTIDVTNTGQSDALNVLFADTPGQYTTLVVGSVASPLPGSVITSGNNPGDHSIAVSLGDLPALSGSAEITFQVRISTPLPAGVDHVSNQGEFTGDNFDPVLTDDNVPPDTPGDPTVTYVIGTPRLSAEKTAEVVVDADHSGSASAGDTLRYTVTIVNSGDAADTAVSFTDTLDPNTTLVAGTVTTGQGTVTEGNGAGDTSITIDLGTVAGGGGQVVITFRAGINNPLPTGTTMLVNQGNVVGVVTDIVTDDPGVSGEDDPTDTPVAGPTAITLMDFRAIPLGSLQVRLDWTTAAEVNNYGFILKRAAVDDYAQAEQIAFIPSAVPGGNGSGTSYHYVDTLPAGGEWIYWLVDVDTSGVQTPHTQTATADVSDHPPVYLYLPLVMK